MIIFLEWDHIWRADQLRLALQLFAASERQVASSRVFECYRTPRYFARERAWRWGTVFWNMTALDALPVTGKHANVDGMGFVDAYVHNMGLCMSERAMMNKFVIAVAMSKTIDDSPPDQRWYHDSWLSFDPLTNNAGLEMAAGFRDDMPFAYEYNPLELPSAVRAESRPHWNAVHQRVDQRSSTR